VVRMWCKRALDKTDFVCVLITPEAIRSLVNNSQNMSAAEGVERVERRVTAARLRGIVHSANVDVNETMRVMETLGSKAAVLQGANKVACSVLRQHAREESVAAKQRAAQAVEGDVSDAGASSGDVAADGNVDGNADRARGDTDIDIGAAGAAGGDSSGAEDFHEPKAVRMLRGATARRSTMDAAAIAKGRSTRAAAQAPRAATLSGKGKGRAKGTNEGASPLPAGETAIGLLSFVSTRTTCGLAARAPSTPSRSRSSKTVSLGASPRRRLRTGSLCSCAGAQWKKQTRSSHCISSRAPYSRICVGTR